MHRETMDALKAKNALLKSVFYVTEYSTCILVLFATDYRPALGPTEPPLPLGYRGSLFPVVK